MMLPSRSALLKTFLLVFIAGLFLFLNAPFHPVPVAAENQSTQGENTPQPRAIAADQADEVDLFKWRFSTRWSRETEPVMADFSTWTERYMAADSARRSELLPEGIALAKARRLHVAKLIRNNPKLALAQTPPVLVRNQLPPQIVELLEERVTGKGDFLVLGRTDGNGRNSILRRVSFPGAKFDAYVFGDRLNHKSALNISLHGVALDGAMAVSDSPLRAFEEGEPIPADKPLASESCVVSNQSTAPTKDGPRAGTVAAESGDKVYWLCRGGHLKAASDGINESESNGQTAQSSGNTMGPRSVLVMVVDFSDIPGSPTPSETIRTALDNVDAFLRQTSYGDFSLMTKTITPLLRMPRTGAAYGDINNTDGDTELLNDARVASRAAGIDPSLFDFDIVTFANVGFTFRGQGYIGMKGAWVQGPFVPGVPSHELGHNLGLWHAASWNSTNSPIHETGRSIEYGNIFDVMGDSNGFPSNQYSANFKFLLNWLPADNVITVVNSGVYRIYAHDQNSRLPGRAYAIRIPVGIQIASELEDYWIDFRQLFSSSHPRTAEGAILQWGNDVGTQNASRLLDMNFATASMSDAPLAIGNTFRDPDRGLEITPLAKSGSGADAFLDLQINLTTPPILPLPESLDYSTSTWTTSSNGWFGQRSTNHDGQDAAASGPTRDGSVTWFETTVEGPGGISFWWKVSSEFEYDFLHFQIDGAEMLRISGDVDWEQHRFELTPGPHTLRWTYEKDLAQTGGADRAWVDQFRFDMGDRPPFVNVQPAPATVGVGDTAEFRVQAAGSPPLQFQWRKGTAPIPNATNSVLTITNVQLSHAGEYSVAISNPFGATASSNALLTVWRLVLLEEALDFAADWQSFGAIGWRGQSQVSFDGIDAAQTGAITNRESSSLTATISGPGTLSFYWKVSCEHPFDGLNFYLDGELVETISGEIDWTQKSLLIPNGPHIVRWTYAKDSSLSKGQDAGWIDRVEFQPVSELPARITSAPAPQSASLGGTAIFKVGYLGSEPISFQWYRAGMALNARPGLNGVNSAELTVSNVQSTDAGDYQVLVKNAFGEELSSPAPLQIVALSLADAVDQPGRLWTTGGDAFWRGVANVSHDGADSAASGIPDNQDVSWIQTEIAGPATLSFWWKVSSETNFDTLSVEVDAVSQRSISGEVNWRQETLNIGSGLHRVRWKYHKDANTDVGEDTGWLDQVQIVAAPAAPEIRDLSVTSGSLNATIVGLQGARFIVEVSSDLAKWTAISSNDITSSTMPIQRNASKNAEFIRIKVE